MTNPTTTVASYSMTRCNSMANTVACPTSNRVVWISNIPFHIAFTVQGFMAKVITRITITIKTISIPGNLVPSWNCLFFESALRSGANSLINSLMSSCSNVFYVLCKYLERNFSFRFWGWRIHFHSWRWSICFRILGDPCPNSRLFFFPFVTKRSASLL